MKCPISRDANGHYNRRMTRRGRNINGDFLPWMQASVECLVNLSHVVRLVISRVDQETVCLVKNFAPWGTRVVVQGL